MMPEARVAAPLTADVAARIARDLYGLKATIRVRPREDSFVDMQCRAFTHLAGRAPHLALPRVIPSLNREFYTRVGLADETSRLVMLSYLPGTMLAAAKPHTPELL